MNSSKEEGIIDSLKKKKLLLATWGCKIPTSQEYRDWQPIFRKIFKELIIFSFKNEYYHSDRDNLNKNFLNLIKKEKPDYLLACPAYNELSVDSMMKMKKINPQMKTIIWFGDDDFRYDDWSRYYTLFFDFVLTASKKNPDHYEKDGIKTAYSMTGINPKYHRPMNLKKIYDVTFIGAPLKDRYDYIKFLKDSGINIKLFGGSWQYYPDLKDIYGGFLSPEDYIKVINQTKINLNFSKTFFPSGDKGAMKGRPMEVLACNAFILNEYTTKINDFILKTPEYNFKTKEELLKKIKYYLKHEDERIRLAEFGRKEVLKDYVWEDNFKKYFKKFEENPIKKLKLPKIQKKVFKISKKEMNQSSETLRRRLKDIDYLELTNKKFNPSKNKEYLQSYSLKVSNKKISLCDYNVISESLGTTLIFLTKKSFFDLNKKSFYKLLNLNQIMVEKEYFLQNIKNFKKLYEGNPIDFIKDEDVVFISIPLVDVESINPINFEDMKQSFKMVFFDKLFQGFLKKRFIDIYVFNFFLKYHPAKRFMIKYFFNQTLDKNKWKNLRYV